MRQSAVCRNSSWGLLKIASHSSRIEIKGTLWPECRNIRAICIAWVVMFSRWKTGSENKTCMPRVCTAISPGERSSRCNFPPKVFLRDVSTQLIYGDGACSYLHPMQKCPNFLGNSFSGLFWCPWERRFPSIYPFWAFFAFFIWLRDLAYAWNIFHA